MIVKLTYFGAEFETECDFSTRNVAFRFKLRYKVSSFYYQQIKYFENKILNIVRKDIHEIRYNV